MNIIQDSELDTKIVHRTKIDFAGKKIEYELARLVQYDDKLVWVAVELFKNGKPYSLSVLNNVRCNIRWRKYDGTFVYTEVKGVNQNQNVVYIEITREMSSYSGEVDAVLELIVQIDGSDAVAGSTKLPIVIDKNPIQDSELNSASVVNNPAGAYITVGNTRITESQLNELLRLLN